MVGAHAWREFIEVIMKIHLDLKFIATTVITFILLIVIVLLVNAIAGIPAASVVGTVLGGIILKLYDKLDYSPTVHFDLSEHMPIAPTIISGIFILYGSMIFFDILKYVTQITYGKTYICEPIAIVSSIILDWGGFALGGWLIGKLFSSHALRITAVAGFFIVVVFTIATATGRQEENFRILIECMLKKGYLDQAPTNEDFNKIIFGSKIGGFLGGMTRAYLAIVMARVSSRRTIQHDSIRSVG